MLVSRLGFVPDMLKLSKRGGRVPMIGNPLMSKEIENVRYAVLEAKHDVNVIDGFGNTPLHWAVYNGNIEVVRFLVENKSSLTILNDLGKTPLHVAAELGYADIARVLIEYKASLIARTCVCYQPLHLSAHKPMADAPTPPFQHNFIQGRVDVAHVLIANGAPVNDSACDNETPLYLAVVNDLLPVAEILRNNGASEI